MELLNIILVTIELRNDVELHWGSSEFDKKKIIGSVFIGFWRTVFLKYERYSAEIFPKNLRTNKMAKNLN